MTWSSGYFTDLNYTHGYYRDMSPAMLDMACLCAGIAPQLRDRPTYLELGYGQGLSINIHAAATDGSYWGTDFNPGQAVHARTLSAASNADLELFDDSFDEFAARTDLPDFDIIALHGIWSWISEANRMRIIDIIRRKLRAGGIVYISYNCLPGWAASIPVRQLMTLYREHGGGQMVDVRASIMGALQFSNDVFNAGSLYFEENPNAAHHLERLKKQNPNYIAHEYLNADWHLVHFADMARSLEDAKLSFVGSTRLLNRIDALHVTEDARKFLDGIGNPILRETVRDYLVNQRFRSDVFIKGASSLNGRQQGEAWKRRQFVLTSYREDTPKKLGGALRELEFTEDINAIIEALSENDYAPKRIEELMSSPKLGKLPLNEIVRALVVLMSAEAVSPAQPVTEDMARRCRDLNSHLLRRALVGNEIQHLASPVTGGGIPVSHMSQLFMLAIEQGRQDASELANFAWDLLESAGERLMRDGQPIESREDNLNEILSRAERFIEKSKPLLDALKVG